MRVVRLDDPAEFLARTLALRAAEPVLTNVAGSIAQSVVDGRTYDSTWWWVVSDGAGEPVGCAVRTAPWNLILGPMPDAAAAALGRAVEAEDPGLPGLVGQRATVRALVDALRGHTDTRLVMTDVVHVLGELVEPVGVPGEVVDARLEEMDLLEGWHEMFAQDAGVPARNLRASIEQRITTGGLVWWCVDGEPVSMAGNVAPVATPGGMVGRIGPVFTPERFRRHGYGAAVTAAVARRLLARCSVVMLFADAANPTSNGVYQRLGFRPTAEVVEVELLGARGQNARDQ